MRNVPAENAGVEALRLLALALLPILRTELALAPPTTDRTTRYVTQKTATAYGMTRRRFLELVRVGKLPASRDGRAFIVAVGDLEAYLAKHRIAPAVPEAAPANETNDDGESEAAAWGLVAVGGRPPMKANRHERRRAGAALPSSEANAVADMVRRRCAPIFRELLGSAAKTGLRFEDAALTVAVRGFDLTVDVHARAEVAAFVMRLGGEVPECGSGEVLLFIADGPVSDGHRVARAAGIVTTARPYEPSPGHVGLS